MYSIFVFTHSTLRWLVLAAISYLLIRSCYGWLKNKPYTSADNNVRLITLIIVHIQALLGITLYAISPVIRYFLTHFKEAVHEKEFRFFGMEHSLMMIIAVTCISIGLIKSKKKATDKEKFKTIAIWLSISLLIILTSIPWNVGEFTANRPLLRGF
ncbi:hypothetical protein [Cytophaga hutchinsonii]|jgi:heme A synthase|uniref:Cytochrome B n=1 Tax=Cytophaga hutchinsonii (strain ATCC 33406 / DSM 1761 / CIP 103989 / NBRC 15051 / NCIMB 9469 / D465) TaxID=269798 RepID=A0A6N4SXA4_CYTH3|nr:hypothetical protein [Cytophaga hutchinsonii]ABG60894.1 conserved hypothetical protein [Cytophaga hutchinsonii ATCC 33406]SFX42016.1 hypothetical protein SAMN04487930_1047 [Cytophaga hutchinsonii ATCC 33406]